MGAISNLFGYLLNWIYNWLGNYGYALIIFSILLRLFLLPITIKQQKSMKKNAVMQEKMREIQKKYKNNPEKLNQETIELYKKEKFSPFSGCLSSILQIVIILAVFYLVSKPLTFMKKVDAEIINKYSEEIAEEYGRKSAYTEIEIIQKKSQEDNNVFINMDFLGVDLSKVPSQNLKDWKVYIIPVLYVVTSFISIRLTNSMTENKKKLENKLLEETNPKNDDCINVSEKEIVEEKDEQDEALEAMNMMNKNMSYMFPIMSISIAFIAPLGLALYWFISNLLMIIERILMKIIIKDNN